MIGAAKCLMSSTLLSTVAALDVSKLFATSLYTGTNAAQTITNGINLAGKGGLVWAIMRSGGNNDLFDTYRGGNKALVSNTTGAELVGASSSGITTFNSNGFSFGTCLDGENFSGSQVAWSFAQDPRFFKIVTYTGNGTTQVIPHGLDPSVSVGMVIIKRRNAASTIGWPVWHRSLAAGNIVYLNTVSAQTTTSATNIFGNNSAVVAPSTSGVTVGNNADVNASGGTYVMYVFAHDTASDGVVQCGGFSSDASGNGTVTLGWRPQFAFYRVTSAAGNGFMVDGTRGWGAGTDNYLFANTTGAEQTGEIGAPNSTGFAIAGETASASGFYIAIRAPGG